MGEGDRPLLEVGDVERVLIVGTAPAARTVERALGNDGAAPTRVATTAEALEVLAEDDVDCVVAPSDRDDESDSPAERIAAIRAAAPTQPILAVLDPNRETEDAAQALSAGATDVLETASSPAVIAARVRNAVRLGRHARTEGERAAPREPAGETNHRAILEAAGQPILVLASDGSVAYATPALEAQAGYTPAELERRDLSRLVHPEDREAAIETFAAVAGGGVDASVRGTYRLRHADGSWHRCDVRFHNREADPAVGGVVVAITPASATAFAEAFERDAIADLSYPFLATDEDWTITEANDAAGGLLDSRESELEGTTLWERLPDAVRGTVFERAHEAVATGDVVTFAVEERAFEAGADGRDGVEPANSDGVSPEASDAGGTLEVDVHPLAAGVALYVRDPAVPARGVDERARQFETVVDAFESGVFVLDGRTVALANPALYEFVDVAAPVGRDVAAVVGDSLAERILERARSPIRRTDPLEATLEAEGRARPVTVSVVPIPAAGSADEADDGDRDGRSGEDDVRPDRVLCVVRDDEDRTQLRDALEAVREGGDELADRPTREAVCRTLLSRLFDLTDATVGCVYLLEGETYRPIAAATDEGPIAGSLPAVPAEETVLDAVRGGEARSSPADGSFDGLRSHTGIRSEYVLAVPVGEFGVVLLAAHATSAVPSREAIEALASTAAIALERVDRTTALGRCERDRIGLRDRLGRLEALTERYGRIESASIEATTREVIERVACEEAIGFEGVSFAWVGSVEPGADELTPRASAGPHESYLEAVALPIDGADAEPACRAASGRTTVLVDPADESAGGWATAALERGFRAILGVPLQYDEFVYGTLTLYADEPGAFEDPVGARLSDLGRLLAFVVHALETKTALLTDGVTQLEFAVEGGVDPLAVLADRTGGRLRVETIVPRSASTSTVFLSVEGTSPAAVEDAARAIDEVRSCRARAPDADWASFELIVDSTLAATLVDHAAVLRWIDATDERARYGVELPQRGDVRGFVRAFERVFPGAELLARRERDRTVGTPEDLRSALETRLTERQRRALEAAYYGGYFEWPRERTGEEVAASLGVSQPTFNRHFRTAERKLYTLLFEEVLSE